MKSLILAFMMLAAPFSFADVTILNCTSTANSLGDHFEYHLRIESRPNGTFALGQDSEIVLKPLNLVQSKYPGQTTVISSAGQIQFITRSSNRLTEQVVTERFSYDRGTKDFTLARSTQDLSKTQSAESGLLQIQNGSCSEK